MSLHSRILSRAASITALSLFSVGSVSAELPSLNKQPWFGYFAGYQNKRVIFGISSTGSIKVTPLNDRGRPFGPHDYFTILFGVEETLPDGKTDIKGIKADTLTSEQPATDKLEKVVIRGKTSSDAEFEATFTQDRGVISITGRVVDPGKLKNPTRFGVMVKIPNTFPIWMKDGKNKNPKAEENLQKRLETDSLKLTWVNGKNIVHNFAKPVDAGSPELGGPGIAKAEMEIAPYKNRKFSFISARPSLITLSNTSIAPLCEGFLIHWTADPAGKATFSIELK
jgi:hypothetical protein